MRQISGIAEIATTAFLFVIAVSLGLNFPEYAHAAQVGSSLEAKAKTPTPDLNGNWNGTFSSTSTNQSGTLSVTIEQTAGKKSFAGSYVFQSNNGSSSGTLSGSVRNTDTMKATLKDPADGSKCKLKISGTVSSDLTTISGAFKWASGCTLKGYTGTFEITSSF